MNKYIERKLFDYEELVPKIHSVGKEISSHFRGENVVFICVLKGAMTFFGHLLKYIDLESIETDYIHVKSYEGTSNKPGEVKLIANPTCDLENKNIVIVEDLVDSGYTLKYLKTYFKTFKPKTISSVVLANKPNARKTQIEPEWSVVDLPNDYVVGFGFDFHDNLRQLPYIGILKKKYY